MQVVDISADWDYREGFLIKIRNSGVKWSIAGETLFVEYTFCMTWARVVFFCPMATQKSL